MAMAMDTFSGMLSATARNENAERRQTGTSRDVVSAGYSAASSRRRNQWSGGVWFGVLGSGWTGRVGVSDTCRAPPPTGGYLNGWVATYSMLSEGLWS